MDNAFYIKDNYYFPEQNQGMKMSIVEEQVNQESYRHEEEEEDEKEINNSNNEENSKEEEEEQEKINNFSFGKHDKRLLEGSVKNEEKSNPINLYQNNNESSKNQGEEDEILENNFNSEYSTPNEEAGEFDEEDFDYSKNEDSMHKRYYDSEKESNEEFPNIINLFKEDSGKEKKNLENQKRILEITEAFNLFDKDCDGNIDIKELVTVMRTLGYDPNKEELEDIIKTFDVDKSGTIDKEEFITLLTIKMKEQKDDKDLLEIFNMFDKDRDGLISENDINYIIDEIGEEFEDEIIKELISMGDDDKDGKINFIEFKKIFNSKNKG